MNDVKARKFCRHEEAVSNERAVSLLSVIIALAMASIVLLGATTFMSHVGASMKNIQIRADIVDLRSMILRQFSCEKTLALLASTCSGDPIQIIANSGKMLIDIPKTVGSQTTYTKIGSLSLKAACVNCSAGCSHMHKIFIQYAILDGHGVPIKDPLNSSITYSFENGDLFSGIPLGCEVGF